MVIKDRVRETTTTIGLGTLTLLGAVTNFLPFSSEIGDGIKTTYAVVHRTSNEWEIREGVYTLSGTTLTRGALIASSTGSAVNFSAGTKDVFVTAAASRLGGPGFGGTLSNSAGDATNDITIAAGARWDHTYVSRISWTGVTRRLDENWVAGSGTDVGMRYSVAAIANGTYHNFVAWKADGTKTFYAYPAVADEATVLAALQAETGGADYIYICRLGAILRESGVIVPFLHTVAAKEFLRVTSVLDLNYTIASTGPIVTTLAVPDGVPVLALMNAAANGDAAGNVPDTYLYNPAMADQISSNSAAPLASVGSPHTSAGGTTAQVQVRTNSSRQIERRHTASSGTSTLRLAALGWVDSTLGGF